jgi:hypothetical protein
MQYKDDTLQHWMIDIKQSQENWYIVTRHLLGRAIKSVMNCADDYVNKPEKYKCLGNTIDGNIFNKHNDQEKKGISKKDLFYLHACNKVDHLLWFTILAQHETNDVILYIYSVHKHRGNSFQRQNYKMRLKQRSLNWMNSMQVKKILYLFQRCCYYYFYCDCQ